MKNKSKYKCKFRRLKEIILLYFFIIYVILSLDFALMNNAISIITNLVCIYDRGDKDEQSFIKVKWGSLSR